MMFLKVSRYATIVLAALMLISLTSTLAASDDQRPPIDFQRLNQVFTEVDTAITTIASVREDVCRIIGGTPITTCEPCFFEIFLCCDFECRVQEFTLKSEGFRIRLQEQSPENFR